MAAPELPQRMGLPTAKEARCTRPGHRFVRRGSASCWNRAAILCPQPTGLRPGTCVNEKGPFQAPWIIWVQGPISRHSRNLLRAYKQQGSMDLAIGTRHVEDRFLESTPQERALYDTVEDFISTQYAQATGQKKSAVGFVMTIYRRRLASSVAALVSTLEKRLAGQQQQLEEDAAASEDDDITGELTLDLEGMQSAFQEASL